MSKEYVDRLKNKIDDKTLYKLINEKLDEIKIELSDLKILSTNFQIQQDIIKETLYEKIINDYLNNIKTITIDDLRNNLLNLYDQIDESGYKFNTIIGIPRGGTLLALLLSYMFDARSEDKLLIFIPNISPYNYAFDQYPEITLNKNERKLLENKTVLLVDDGILTGKTMITFKNEIKRYSIDVRTAVLNYNAQISEMKPDYYASTENVLIQYPWKFLANPLFKKIDGINSQGQKYYQVIYKIITNKNLSNYLSKLFKYIINQYKRKTTKLFEYELFKNNLIHKLDIHGENYSCSIEVFNNVLQITTINWNNIYKQEQEEIIETQNLNEYKLNLNLTIPTNVILFNAEMNTSTLRNIINNSFKKLEIEVIEITKELK